MGISNKNQKDILSLIPFFIFILVFSYTCDRKRESFRQELKIKNKHVYDSVMYCDYIREKTFELIKRGNLILYHNIGNFLHAREYFLSNYDIQLLPEDKINSICAKPIMDSVIFSKFGTDLVFKAEREISKLDTLIPTNEYSNGVFAAAEIAPEYPGGIDSLLNDLHKNIDELSICQVDLKFGCDLIVNFIVDTNGYVKDPQIVLKLCPEIDSKIFLATQNLKQWRPGINNGVKVPVLISLRLSFEDCSKLSGKQ